MPLRACRPAHAIWTLPPYEVAVQGTRYTVHTHCPSPVDPRRPCTLFITSYISSRMWGGSGSRVCSRASRGRRLRPNNFISMQHIFAISISYFHIFDEILLFIRFVFVLLSLSLSRFLLLFCIYGMGRQLACLGCQFVLTVRSRRQRRRVFWLIWMLRWVRDASSDAGSAALNVTDDWWT